MSKRQMEPHKNPKAHYALTNLSNHSRFLKVIWFPRHVVFFPRNKGMVTLPANINLSAQNYKGIEVYEAN